MEIDGGTQGIVRCCWYLTLGRIRRARCELGSIPNWPLPVKQKCPLKVGIFI